MGGLLCLKEMIESDLSSVTDVHPRRVQQPRLPAGCSSRGFGPDGLLPGVRRLWEPLEGRPLLPGTTPTTGGDRHAFLTTVLLIVGADIDLSAAQF